MGSAQEKPKATGYHADLMYALDVSPKDLDANRAGKLSTYQRSGIWLSGMFSCLLAPCFALLVTVLIFQALIGRLWALPMAIICAVISGYFMLRVERNAGIENKVLVLRGVIHKKYYPRRWLKPAGCVIQIGPDEFTITPAGFNALIETHEYLLYVEPGNNQIVSAEPALKRGG